MSLLLPIAAAIAALLVTLHFATRRHPKLPPGPPGLPIVGNLFDLPKSRPWVKMEEWTRKYGPIYSLKMGTTTVIVLGRAKHAIDLLDKRSAIYSSRPRLVMTSELVSRGLRMTFMPYGDLWRNERRLLHQLTSPKASAEYEPIQDMESAQLVRDMLEKPADFWGHCQRYAGSTIMQIAFNKRAPTPQDPAIVDMRRVNELMTQTAVPGRYIVDSIPILNLLPSFLASWKCEADAIFRDTLKLFQSHVDKVRRDMKEGKDAPCFAKYILDLQDQYKLKDNEATFLAGAMYGAGSDTTADAISTFLLTMTAHPHVLAKAQEELDRVVGKSKMPDFSDKDSLPYCNAIVREIMRWRTVIAGGLAHSTIQDDVYEDYFIPKGATVLANHWAIHLDPELYPAPETFKPERFIDAEGKLCGTIYSERGHHGFGFGRRICPGLHIAERSLYIVFVRMMWAASIRTARDVQGNEIPVDVNAYSEGFSSHPLKFTCDIKPREEEILRVVKAAVAENEVVAEAAA